MGKNILIVDDSAVMRKIIQRSLRQAGINISQIFEGGDGSEGLAVLQENSPDLIFSDINMPNMNGLEFVKNVRAKGIQTPIVMITTEGGEDKVDEALKLGANGYVKKPFTPQYLQDKLRKLL